jgi:hypothetical protein
MKIELQWIINDLHLHAAIATGRGLICFPRLFASSDDSRGVKILIAAKAGYTHNSNSIFPARRVAWKCRINSEGPPAAAWL